MQCNGTAIATEQQNTALTQHCVECRQWLALCLKCVTHYATQAQALLLSYAITADTTIDQKRQTIHLTIFSTLDYTRHLFRCSLRCHIIQLEVNIWIYANRMLTKCKDNES